MSNSVEEPPDNTTYQRVYFYPETVQFIFRSIVFYQGLLENDAKAPELEGDLKELMASQPKRASVLDRELSEVNRMVEWHKEKQDRYPDFTYDLGSLSHGFVRQQKSMCLLYLKHLQNERDVLSRRTNLSRYALEDVDSMLSRLREKLSSGIFANATPVPLLIDEITPPSAEATGSSSENANHSSSVPLVAAQAPKPRVLASIEIVDQTLRERCLDLFQKFHADGKPDRLDTVLVEATRVLEDRMRTILEEKGGVDGSRLAVVAFGKDSPKLIISPIAAEQEAVMLLFKGIFGHVRNPSHHKLLGELNPERILQCLGLVDYAIHLLESASKQPPPTP